MKGAIFFVVDAKFFPLAAIQAVRALETSDREIDVHVFVDGAGSGEVQFDPQVLAKSAGRLHLHRGELAALTPAALPTPKSWPREIYGRLFAPQIINADRLLYLDVDIVIDGPLDELFSLDMRGAALGATYDVAIEEAQNRTAEKTPSETRPAGARYFNSGMLLIDRRLWLDREMEAEALSFISKRNGRGYVDQDFLNYLFPDWLPLSPRWNCLIPFLETGLQEAIDPRVVHVTGFVKPWHREFADQYPAYAREFAAQVSAAHVDLDKLPAQMRTPGFKPLKKIRIDLHSRIYKLGFVTRRTRAHFDHWRARRARFIEFLTAAAEQGLFADAFAFAPTPTPEPPDFDGRTFRARQHAAA
ncbi:MAG: glycosyltransferase family 8 protein [Roseiarcus sp.]|jgi:lipopolysaccharide biosynthesis glycosyltransferase